MNKIFILIVLIAGLGFSLPSTGYSLENHSCLAPKTVLENQKDILSAVYRRLFQARDLIENKKKLTREGIRRMDFRNLNLKCLDLGTEYYVFALQDYPRLVFKIPRSLHPTCYPVQYVNMKLIELSLESRGKVNFLEVDGFSLTSIPGFMPYLFSGGMVIQERAEVVLEDDEAIINKLVETVEENGIMDLDPTDGNIGVVNRKTDPEPLFIDMGLVSLRDRDIIRMVNKTDSLSVLGNSRNIGRFIMNPEAVLSETRDTLFYAYIALNLNPDLIMPDILELMTPDDALISYYYYQALLDKKTQNEALEESFQFFCLYKKERQRKLKAMQEQSMTFLKELLKSA